MLFMICFKTGKSSVYDFSMRKSHNLLYSSDEMYHDSSDSGMPKT